MKRFSIIGLIIISIVLSVSTAFAVDLVKSGSSAGKEGGEAKFYNDGTTLYAEFPVYPSQGPAITSWQIACSYACATSKSGPFSLYSDGAPDYTMATGVAINSANYIKAELKPPAVCTDIVWPRCWIKGYRSNNWGWINQGANFARTSESGDPGYEALCDTKKRGDCSRVPADFPRRP